MTEGDVGLFSKFSTELEKMLLKKLLKANHDTSGLIHRCRLSKPGRKGEVARLLSFLAS